MAPAGSAVLASSKLLQRPWTWTAATSWHVSNDYGIYGGSAEWQAVSAGKLDPWARLMQGQASFPGATMFLKLKICL